MNAPPNEKASSAWPEELTPEMESVWRSAFMSQGHLRRNDHGRAKHTDSCESAAYRALRKFVLKGSPSASSQPLSNPQQLPEAPKVEQEPVAWRWRFDTDLSESMWFHGHVVPERPENAISTIVEMQPLYTHPAPASDELLQSGRVLIDHEPCPKCQSVNVAPYWWHTGLAWIIVCQDCRHEKGRESEEHKAWRVWDEAAKHKGPQS